MSRFLPEHQFKRSAPVDFYIDRLPRQHVYDTLFSIVCRLLVFSLTTKTPIVTPRFPAGGLASYTPLKQSSGADFELGVSRLTPAAPTARPSDPTSSEDPEEFLKPADESETVTWSSETSADILF